MKWKIKLALLAAVGIAALAFLVGCAGNPKTSEGRCENYVALYETYLATTALRPVSKEESAAAMVASVFLRTRCGWQSTRAGTDAQGVPILAPPLAGEAPTVAHPAPASTPEQHAPKPKPRAKATRPKNDPDHVHFILADGASFALPVEQPESP